MLLTIEEIIMKDDINVGDIVEVVDTGKVYATYREWAAHFALYNFVSKDNPKAGVMYKVVAVAPHLDHYVRMLLGLEDLTTGQHYIIEDKGVKKVGTKGDEELKSLGKSLFGKKMRVTPETSELVQKAVFAAGGIWGDDRKIIQYCDTNYLYVSEGGYITRDNSSGYFDRHYASEVTLSVEKKLVVTEVPKIDKAKQEKLDRIARMEEELKQLKRSVEEG